MIQNSASTMKYLIKDMLDRSLIQNKLLVPVFTPVVLTDVVSEAIEVMRYIASSKNVSINFKSDLEKDKMYKIDVNRVLQVINNLISNAIKFSVSGKKITVTATSITNLKSQENYNKISNIVFEV